MLYDVPHIIKNIRNNLLTYDFHVDGKVASLTFLRQMFDEEQMSSLRLAPKLTRHHFDMLPFKKMNIRLAAQLLLSHSTAAAVRTCTHFGRLEEAALDTADFVEKIDQLFDCLNSTSVSAEHKWKKPLILRAVDQLNFLNPNQPHLHAFFHVIE